MLTNRCRIISAALTLHLTFASPLSAQNNIVYDTSPSTGRVLSIRVEDKAPAKLPAVPLPQDAPAQDIANAMQQLNSMSVKPTPAPKTLKFAPRFRSATPLITAKRFVSTYGGAFGASNPTRDLFPLKEEKDSLGMSHVRFTQSYKGIPVFGAEMIAHVGADGNVKSLNGKVGSGINVPTRTRINQVRAGLIAKKLFKDKYPRLVPTVKQPKLFVYQPALLENTNSVESYLVWQVRVSNENWVDETYLLNAVSGELVRTLDNVRGITRKIYDCSAEPGTDVCWSNRYNAGLNYTFGCQEGLCPHGPNPRYLPEVSTDTDNLYFTIAHAHDYYQQKFGRNGANGQGGNTNGSVYGIDMDMGRTYLNWLSTSADDCISTSFWEARGIGFCKGTVLTDLVGHEYAHGVRPGLIYSGETGSIDESHSDIMGEMLEYWWAGANDWLVGNPSFYWNRNLAEPPLRTNPDSNAPYPDRYTSDDFYCGTADNNGNHVNSTVPSKAMYLASVGGVFNGCNIEAVGREHVEQILYRAYTQYYVSSETFNGAYEHLLRACTDLYPDESCAKLAKALQSVEMDQAGKCSDPTHQLTHPANCQCEDSDDWQGTGKFLEQASVLGSVESQSKTSNDACMSRKILMENYCCQGQKRQALISCSKGCANGACTL